MPIQVEIPADDDGVTPAAVARAVQAGADLLLDLANENVPVDTGALRDSGKAYTNGEVGTVRYFDRKAHLVHERVEDRHERGEAKWLENAARNHGDEIAEAIAEKMRNLL